MNRFASDVESFSSSVDDAVDDAPWIDVDGFEGPLDLLLHLARRRRVDLTRISVLSLTDQYLESASRSASSRLEIAVEFLIMAAWLAYLKSTLLSASTAEDDSALAAAEETAERIAFRMRRLEAMRDSARRLFDRPLLGRDVFARGRPERVVIDESSERDDSLLDLLRAYGLIQRRTLADRPYRPPTMPVWSVRRALRALRDAVALGGGEWRTLSSCLSDVLDLRRSPSLRASARASSFAAILEMARAGTIDIRQDVPFGDLYVRRREARS